MSFPYDAVYPEQFEYMMELKKLLEHQVSVLLAASLITKKNLGSCSPRNAYRDREDSMLAFSYSLLYQAKESQF
jgi:hypothetical protein